MSSKNRKFNKPFNDKKKTIRVIDRPLSVDNFCSLNQCFIMSSTRLNGQLNLVVK